MSAGDHLRHAAERVDIMAAWSRKNAPDAVDAYADRAAWLRKMSEAADAMKVAPGERIPYRALLRRVGARGEHE